jgi:hypothetical protein
MANVEVRESEYDHESKNQINNNNNNNSSKEEYYFVERHTRTKLSVKANSLGPSEWNRHIEGVVEQETLRVKKFPTRSPRSKASTTRKDDTELSHSNNSSYTPRSSSNSTRTSLKVLTPRSSTTSRLRVEDLDTTSYSSNECNHKRAPNPTVEML